MVKIVSLDKFADEIRDLAKKQRESFKNAVIEALYEQLPKLVSVSPVDTGLYSQSWQVEVEKDMAMIGNYAPHAPIIEFGARPFMPPLGPLLYWAKRILQKTELDSEVYALAVGTQQKIAREGMKPKFILTNAIEEIMVNIRKKMNENRT